MIDRALDRHLKGLPGQAHSIWKAVRYGLFPGGKRIRPILTVAAGEVFGGKLKDLLPFACAVEMIHTYSLIHDDLPAMDDDDLRRGQPTCHRTFGEAGAILAGDALLTGAFQVLAEGYPPRTAAVSCLELAKGAGAVGMVGGQVLDLQAEGKIGRQESEVRSQQEGATSSLIPDSCLPTPGERAPLARLEDL